MSLEVFVFVYIYVYIYIYIYYYIFSFYVVSNIVKYFLDYFPECNQTQKYIYIIIYNNNNKKIIFLKSFTFANILRWKIIYSETNGA
jgi:hypothetical protein